MEEMHFRVVRDSDDELLNAIRVARECRKIKNAGARVASIVYVADSKGWYIWYESDSTADVFIGKSDD